VHQPLALAIVAEADWAMRELMRRTLDGVGFRVEQCASSLQLERALDVNAVMVAHHVLVVAANALAAPNRALISDASRARAAGGRAPIHVALTCEFGALMSCAEPHYAHCFAAGLLEKPFDFNLLAGVAYRCRTAGSVSLLEATKPTG
jgi:hypothetical protein